MPNDGFFDEGKVVLDEFDGVIALFDLGSAGLELKRRLLLSALGLLQFPALLLELFRGARVRFACGNEFGLQRRAPFFERAHIAHRGIQLLALVRRLSVDFAQFCRDLLAALGHALRLLGHPEDVQLGIVVPLLQILNRRAQRAHHRAVVCQLLLCGCECALQASEMRLRTRRLRNQLADLALARQHAVQFRVGGVQTHAMARKCMALGRNEHRTGRQLTPLRKPLFAIGDDIDVMQPVGKHAGHRRVLASHVTRKRREISRGRRDLSGTCGINRQLARRTIGKPSADTFQFFDRNTIKTLAQHRFQGVFPAALDFDVLPQTPCCCKLVPGKPGMHVFAAGDAILNLLQRGDACCKRCHFLACGLRLGAAIAQRLLLVRQALLGLVERGALVAILRVERRKLIATAFKLGTVRGREERLFLAQPLLALCKLPEDPFGVLAARLLNLMRLRILGGLGLHRVALTLARAERLLGNGQLFSFAGNRGLADEPL